MEEKKEEFSQIPPAGAPPAYDNVQYGAQNYGSNPTYGSEQYKPSQVDPEVHYMVWFFSTDIDTVGSLYKAHPI